MLAQSCPRDRPGLQQGADAAAEGLGLAHGGLGDAGEDLEQGGLTCTASAARCKCARPVAENDTHHLAALDFKGNALEAPDGFFRDGGRTTAEDGR